MGNVIDVSTDGEPAATVLTRTASGGLLGGDYLRSEPLSAYLGDVEVPRYVLRNRKSGLRIEASGEREGGSAGSDAATDSTVDSDAVEHLEPARDYQALAAVTDVRVVFVVGTAEGDRSASIPLSEVATVAVEEALLGGELRIATANDDRYVFPCRGDLAPIAEYVDRGAQAWARAYTLIEDAREAMATAERRRREGNFAGAVAAIDECVDAVDTARDRLATFGAGAKQSFVPETAELVETVRRRRREVHVEHGVDAHERARTHWENGEYERAHDAYREAVAALERARELRATPDVDERLDRIATELDDLADAPLAYADAMVDEGAASDDPRTAAQCYAVAVERYRDAYALDWGRDDGRFRGDPSVIRDRILDALDALVASRIEATQRRLEEAEWLRRSDDLDGAHDVLVDALDTVDGTRRLVDELTHREYRELDAVREDVCATLDRVSGD